jgi:hypothetical protein
MDIYGHLQIAEEVLESPDLNPELKALLSEYRNYFNLGNFVPDLQYIIVRMMIIMVFKNVLFGTRDYRRVTKKTDLEHVKSSELLLNGFKTVDDSIRYYKRDVVISKSTKVRKQIALLCGVAGHVFADRFIHYVIEKIQFEAEFAPAYFGRKPSHQEVEISFSYFWLKSKDKDWYNFTDKIRVPLTKHWFRKLIMVRDEAIHPLLQQMDLLTYHDQLGDNQINMALNNLMVFGKYLRFFSIYRKIKKGSYIYDFDAFKESSFNKDGLIEEVEYKVVPKIASVLNFIYKMFTSEEAFHIKAKNIKELLGNIDAVKPEEYTF